MNATSCDRKFIVSWAICWIVFSTRLFIKRRSLFNRLYIFTITFHYLRNFQFKLVFKTMKQKIYFLPVKFLKILLKVRNVQKIEILQIIVQFFSRVWQNSRNALIGIIRVWRTLMFCNLHNKQRLGLMVIWFCLKFNVNFYSRVQNAIQRPTLCLFPLCKI